MSAEVEKQSKLLFIKLTGLISNFGVASLQILVDQFTQALEDSLI